MQKPNRKRWLSLTALALLLLGGALWFFWPSRQVARAKGLQEELFSPAARNLSPEQRREKFRELREARNALTPAQRRELSKEMQKRRQAEISKYFKMSAAEKARYLDDRIRQMEQRRQARQGRNGGAGGGPGGGPGGSAAAAGGPQRGGPPRDRSPSERDSWRQERLDSTTPGERAQFTQFMKDLNARRAQLGLPTGRGGPMR
jgi:hypothetical protein